MSEKSFTFNWHDEPDRGFMQYVWLTLMQDADFQDLMERTNGGRSITLSIFANGVEVNAAQLMNGLEMNRQYSIRDGVAELTKSIRLDDLAEKIAQIEKEITNTLVEKFKAIGVEMPTAEDW